MHITGCAYIYGRRKADQAFHSANSKPLSLFYSFSRHMTYIGTNSRTMARGASTMCSSGAPGSVRARGCHHTVVICHL